MSCRITLHGTAKLIINSLVYNRLIDGMPVAPILLRSGKASNVFMQKASSAGFAAAIAIVLASVLASAPALAVPPAGPVVLDPNFLTNDAAANAANGTGQFFLQNWTPTGFASNTNADPGQFDNGTAAGRSVVGFLSGVSSLSQVVQGFVAGRTYRVSVGADARASVNAKPTFQISADNVQVYGPTLLNPVDPVGTFSTAFTAIQSDTFVAANTFVTIRFANATGSDANASTLLSAVSLSQVPEPISLGILGIGLLGVGIARRRGGGTARFCA